MVNSAEAIRYFESLAESGQITKRHAASALKRWAQNGGRGWTTINNVRFTFTNESISCDCGKGIYCPTVKRRQEKP